MVRDWDIVFPPTSGDDSELSVGGVTIDIVQVFVAALFTVHQWRGRQVANPGDIIEVQVSHNAGFAVSGYLLQNT